MPWSFESEPLPNKGRCNRKPKLQYLHPSINETSQTSHVSDLMQLTELVEEVRWQANEHGTPRKTSRHDMENRKLYWFAMVFGFLLFWLIRCNLFFWWRCVCVLKFIAIQTLFPFLLSLWCGMKYFPQHHFEPRVQWCRNLYQDQLRGAQWHPLARVTN